MEALIARRRDDDELALWWLHTQQVLHERHQWTHAILVRHDPRPANGNRPRWSLVQTKDGFEREMPAEADADALLTRMADLCATGYSIAQRLDRERETVDP